MKLINIIAENKDGVLMGYWLFDDFDLARVFMKRQKAYHPSFDWYAHLHDTETKNPSGTILFYEIGDDPDKIDNFK